ncbi:MAG TPA: type II toxin-antitoxin system VapC family toxin [Hanamia sp.]|nr:type II toxin-antitoxin system VapC family toxin [Hanamia sp.]
MILCDTNLFIEIYRNNQSIIQTIKHIGQQNLAVSDVTRAELFFGARNKKELQAIRKDMDKLTVFPVDAFISDKAVKLVELYSLSYKLALPDALIGATAIYHKIELYTLKISKIFFPDEVNLFSL